MIPSVLQKLSESTPTRHLLCPHLSVFHHQDICVLIKNTLLFLDYFWQQVKTFMARRSCLFAEPVRMLQCQQTICEHSSNGIPLLWYLVVLRPPCPHALRAIFIVKINMPKFLFSTFSNVYYCLSATQLCWKNLLR